MSEAHADPTPQPSEPDAFSFRPIHIFYAVTLLLSSGTTFGEWGMLAGIPISGAWAYVFAARSRPKALFNVCALTFVGSCAIVLLQATQQSRNGYPRNNCRMHLKQIGLAFGNYHDTFGMFPPAYVADEHGRPMHSWRVLLLPFLNNSELYMAYNFDEPWNGPHNRQLLSRMPEVYTCPEIGRTGREHGNCTSYVTVVGSGTASPGSTGRSLDEFKDGISNVIMVVECNSGSVPWTQPRELSFEDALRLISSTEPHTAQGHQYESFFYDHYPGRHVLCADGSTPFVPHGFDHDLVSSLLTIDGGGVWPDQDDWSRYPVDAKRIKVGVCIRLAVFVLLVLFPLPWVWLKRRGSD